MGRTLRVSLGAEGVAGGGADPAISGDGSFVAFVNEYGGLLPPENPHRGPDEFGEIYLHELSP